MKLDLAFRVVAIAPDDDGLWVQLKLIGDERQTLKVCLEHGQDVEMFDGVACSLIFPAGEETAVYTDFETGKTTPLSEVEK